MDLSIVDLGAVPVGGTATDALAGTFELASRAEQLGFQRYWLAEHHGRGHALVASNPEVLVAAVAARTATIRVGAGAVLLNSASPFRVAETFRLLAAMHPGRIDLGLGRSGGSAEVDLALRVDRPGLDDIGGSTDSEPELLPVGPFGGLSDWMAQEARVAEVLWWLGEEGDGDDAITLATATGAPGPEPWLVGSTLTSAVLAARLGLPYCYAGFVDPAGAVPALRTYRSSFQPAPDPGRQTGPRAMLAVNVTCADSQAEATVLRASAELFHRQLARAPGRPRRLLAPREAVGKMGGLSSAEPDDAGHWPRLVAGDPERVGELLSTMAEATGADELMVQDLIPLPAERLRSYELVAAAVGDTSPRQPAMAQNSSRLSRNCS